MPASVHLSAPPRTMSFRMSSDSVFAGKPTIDSANTGRAPIAYTSDSAFAAATRPKS